MGLEDNFPVEYTFEPREQQFYLQTPMPLRYVKSSPAQGDVFEDLNGFLWAASAFHTSIAGSLTEGYFN